MNEGLLELSLLGFFAFLHGAKAPFLHALPLLLLQQLLRQFSR